MVTDMCPGTDVSDCSVTSKSILIFSQAICAGDMNHFDLSTEALAVVCRIGSDLIRPALKSCYCAEIALRLLQQDWELQGTTIGKNSTDLKIFDSVPSK